MSTPNQYEKKAMEPKEYYRGKGQPLYAKVYSKDGWIEIGDVELGQLILTHDGTFTEVQAIYDENRTNIYEITFIDGRTSKCCINHLWRLYHPDWKVPHVKPTSLLVNIDPQELHKFAIDLFNPYKKKFDTLIKKLLVSNKALDTLIMDIDTAEEARQLIWSLGGIAYIHQNKNTATISYGFNDVDVKEMKLNISHIEHIDEDKARCIKVANAEYLYVTNDYIVTHNGN